MNVCFVTTMWGSPWGGSESLWASAAQCGLESGHRVAAVVWEWEDRPPPLERLAARGASIFAKPRRSDTPGAGFVARLSRLAIRRFSPHYQKIWRSVRSWKPDFLCISQGSTFDLLYHADLMEFLDSSGIPYGLVAQHGFEHLVVTDDATRHSAITLFKRARWVAFVADGNRRKTERELGALIPNAIVVNNPLNLVDNSAVPWPNLQTPSLGCVARLDAAFKGQDVLLEALGGNRWRHREYRLRFYGGGADRGYLESLARLYGVEGKVEFCGHVDDVRSIWAANHLLVLPSRSEGTPLSLVEAMTCGRPAVVTDVGGNAEWVSEPETGFVAEASTARSIAGALERAWSLQEQWAGIGQKARIEASNRIDPDPGRTLLDLILADSRHISDR